MQPRRVVSGIAAAKVLGGVRMRFVKLPLLLACTTALIAIAQAQVPAGYPADYAKILAGANKESSTGTMRERVSSGENLIGYNILGSYALTRAKKDPSIGIAFTTDYNLVLSRLAFVAKNAKNPNAGKLFLDYLLSKRGQTIAAEQAELYSIRTDITGKDSGVTFAKELGSAVKPIAVSTDLLAGLDQTKRLEFLKQWQTALGRK